MLTSLVRAVFAVYHSALLRGHRSSSAGGLLCRLFSFCWRLYKILHFAVGCSLFQVLCLAVVVQADQLLERPSHYADIVGSLEEQHGPLHTWNASTVHLLLRQASFSDAAADALLSSGVDGYMLSELHVDTFREALGPIAAKKLELLLRDVRAHTGAPGLMSFSEYRARHGDLVTLGLPFLIASPRLGLAAMALDMPDLEQRMAEERGARDVRPTSGCVDRLFGGVYNALSWLFLPELRVWAIVRVSGMELQGRSSACGSHTPADVTRCLRFFLHCSRCR